MDFVGRIKAPHDIVVVSIYDMESFSINKNDAFFYMKFFFMIDLPQKSGIKIKLNTFLVNLLCFSIKLYHICDSLQL